MSSHAQADDQHWSFQPIRRPPLPVRQGGAPGVNPIDDFVRAKLAAQGLPPSPEADRETLARRVTIDLTGLPPTPYQLQAFLADKRPGAYQRFVERLLASPRYGERWARPWLDLCHYGDTDGYLTDQLRPVAWRYRQWLIDALNDDLPLDQLTIQQLAGDLLPHPTNAQRIATGFLRQTLSNREGGAEPEEFRVLQVVDRVEMTAATWLGLTVGCARCHDHFYDDIPQRDFYQLYAFFNNVDEVNFDAPLPEQAGPYAAALPDYARRRRAAVDAVGPALDKLQEQWELRLLRAKRNPGEDAHWDRQWELLGLVWGGGKGEGQLEGVEIVKLPRSRRTQTQRDDLLDYFLRTPGDIDPQQFKQLKLSELRGRLNELRSGLPEMARAATVRHAQVVRATRLHVRGDFRQPGELVRPGTPSCLPRRRVVSRDHADLSSTRLDLARWLVSTDNPLTARVMVNRMWEQLFGSGLVATSEDFGVRGEPPSHPLLLDWLAAELASQGWSVKSMHRLIVTSATYRQSSRPRPELQRADEENRLLGRQNSLRVPAEAVRDMSLAAAGLLSGKMGGPGVKPPQPLRVIMEAFDNKTWEPSDGEDRYRRGIYTFVIRTAPYAQGAIFDAPNPSRVCTRRERSNTPLQALTLLNDAVFFEAAQSLAARLIAAGGSRDERIDQAFLRCLSRRPKSAERRLLHAYLDNFAAQLADDAAAKIARGTHLERFQPREAALWTGLASVVLNLHEFITRD